MSALVKPVYTFIKGVCPIYAHDTGEYVGSAFLICDINYLCHYPKVEGRARATHHYFFFFFVMFDVQRPRAFLQEHGSAGVQKSASERFAEISVRFVSSGGGLVECTLAGRTKRPGGTHLVGR